MLSFPRKCLPNLGCRLSSTAIQVCLQAQPQVRLLGPAAWNMKAFACSRLTLQEMPSCSVMGFLNMLHTPTELLLQSDASLFQGIHTLSGGSFTVACCCRVMTVMMRSAPAFVAHPVHSGIGTFMLWYCTAVWSSAGHADLECDRHLAMFSAGP